MFAPGQNQLLANLSLLLFLRIFRSFVFMILKRTFEECVSLFSYQRSVLHCRLSQTALLLYHVVSCLSRTFFKLFLFLSCSNFDILSHPTGCCQELFSFLFDSSLSDATRLFYHESFQMSRTFFISFHQRRRRDLNPRTAQTVYTLSRGTSSAT